jgi:YVTN family beta-propeller protein
MDATRLSRVLAAALVYVVLTRPVAAHNCVGDCNGDGAVSINELITGVSIALGQTAVTACSAIDSNADGTVTIDELIAAVDAALSGCGGQTFALNGSCEVPGHGNHGFAPCDVGTVITVFRCNDRSQCLHGQAAPQVGQTAVVGGGAWVAQLPLTVMGAPLIVQADVAQAVIFRTLDFGTVGMSLRASLARGVVMAAADINPITEAAVELLDANGFENYPDAGAQAVESAVEQANAGVSFDGVAIDMAAALALQTANGDPLVKAVLTTARNTPTPTVAARPTATPPPGVLFVTDGNANRVSIVDLASSAVVAQVPVGEAPRGITLTPDRSLALVANDLPDTVSIIDTAARQVVATVPDFEDVPDAPNSIAVTPNGRFAYVTNRLSDSVLVLDLQQAVTNPSASMVTRIALAAGARPIGIAAARQELFVYVANSAGGTLSVIDRSTNTLLTTAPLPGKPELVALTSDDATLYVTLNNPDTGGGVSVFDTALLRTPGAVGLGLLKTIPVGSSPTGIAISDDDQFVYVASSAASSLSVISRMDSRAGRVVSTVPLLSGAQPASVALSRDSGVVYTANCGHNSVSFIGASLAVSSPQNAILDTVPAGPCPLGLAVLEP